MEIKTLVDSLKGAVHTDKGITFINPKDQDIFLSYNRLYDKALYFLFNLQQKGIKANDELIFQLNDDYEFLIAYWACILGNITPVPVAIGLNSEHKLRLLQIWDVLNNPYLLTTKNIVKVALGSGDENETPMNHIMNKTILISDCMEEIEHGTCPKISSEDIAFIQFSSGSTGEPKGVILTHKNLLTNIDAMIYGAELTDADSTFSWVPLTHDLGLIGFHLTPLVGGVSQHIMPAELFIKNPMIWMDKSSFYKATILSSPNFGYKHFMNFFKPEYALEWNLSHIRLIFNGAEPISDELSNMFYKLLAYKGLKDTAAFAVYGLAEASLAVTFPLLGEGLKSVLVDREKLGMGCKVDRLSDKSKQSVSFVDLGFPVKGCDIRICDESNNILTSDIVGVVHIKGDNITGGYYNNEEATRAMLTDDGWVDTGDLGFITSDGRLVITGRKKDIIFVNGQNYYPHDIERVSFGIKGLDIREIAVCGAFNSDTQREEIIAFVVYDGNIEGFIPTVEKLRGHINSHTGLEVGSVIPIDRLPKTASGKVQRYKLKESYQDGNYDAVIKNIDELIKQRNNMKQVEKPKNSVEARLIEIWTEVLQENNIGVLDNFFWLGGNSLKATFIASKIKKEFNVDIPLSMLFKDSTIRELGRIIDEADVNKYNPIVRAGVKECYKLSSQQRMIYVLSKLDENSINYNIVEALEIEGKLNKDKLYSSYTQILKNHEVLSTSFIEVNGEPMQVIGDIENSVVDIKSALEEDLEAVIKDFIKPFNLNKAPLIRALLIDIKDTDKYIFVLNIHHIIMDGSSVAILLKDIFDIYNGNEINSPRIGYKDYAQWQQSKGVSSILKQEEYWLDTFSGELPTLNLPVDKKRPLVQRFEGSKIYMSIDNELRKKISIFAKTEQTSLYTVLLSAYYILLHNYSQQEDIIVGSPVVGRTHPDIERVLGMFVNTVAIRSGVNGSISYTDFLAEVTRKTIGAFENQDYPFAQIYNKLDNARDMSRNPLFDTMFVLQNMDISDIGSNGLRIDKYPIDLNISKFDLTLFAYETSLGIDLEFEYSTNIFNKETIETMGYHYINILRSILDDPCVSLSEISMFTSDEKDRLIYGYNQSQEEYPVTKTLQYLFEEQVKATPNSIALHYNDETLTYRELNERSNKLANYLRSINIGRNDIVAIRMDRCLDLLVSIWGVLKSGASYMPIDISNPKDRIEYMLVYSDAKLLIDNGESIKLDNHILKLNMNDQAIECFSIENPTHINHSLDLAYLIYTSGSTGKPKGTMLEHHSVINYVCWAAKSYVGKEDVIFPLYTNISFDLTVTSLFVPLMTGNSIVIYDDDKNEMLIQKILDENRVRVVKVTPAHLRVIKNRDNKNSKVKRFIVGGEQLETKLAKSIYDSFDGDIEIYNEYGPTETAVGCMIYKYNHSVDTDLAIPIGMPADNVNIYILDKSLNPVNYNTVGEMYISGEGVARGYINNIELTDNKFLKDPFKANQMMYKTGDLAKRLKNGNIVFIGRYDDQIKIRGYRVEIGEIENRLLEHEEIKDVVIAARIDSDGNKYLCGYYTANDPIVKHELREFILNELPDYMVPSYFMMIDDIPLTRNGKVDKKVLPDPLLDIVSDTDYVQPKDDIERVIASTWEKVLGVNRVGIMDNYYSLGGDSIKAIQIVSNLNQEGIDIKVKDILTSQTIHNLKDKVSKFGGRDYQQGLISGNIPLLSIHNWFIDQQFENLHHYNQSVCLELADEISIEKLKKCFNALLLHHDGLRLNIDKSSNTLCYNNDINNFDIEDIKLISSNHIDYIKQVESVGLKLKSSLDISSKIPVKVALIRSENYPQILMITIHHIAIDGVSWRILLEDLFNLINNEDDYVLPMKTASLSDWHSAINDYAETESVKEQIEYWKDIDSVDMKLKKDYDTPMSTYRHANTVRSVLDKDNTNRFLTDANTTYNTKPQELLITALSKSFKTWINNDILKLELEGHGRFIEDVNVSRTVGWFTAIYPTKIELVDEDIDKQIKSVKEQLRSIPNNGNDYQILRYITKDLDSSSKTGVRFNYLGSFDNTLDGSGYTYYNGKSGTEVDYDNRMTAEIEIDCMIIGERLELQLKYDSSVYRVDTMKALVDSIIDNLLNIINYTTGKDEVFFTPSDFDTVAVSQDDLDSLFD